VRRDDFVTKIAKNIINSVIKYGFRPDLAKKKRRNFSESTKNQVLAMQCYLCSICQNPLEVYEFDHTNGDPLDNSILNCRALCPNCHAKETRKRAKIRHKKSD